MQTNFVSGKWIQKLLTHWFEWKKKVNDFSLEKNRWADEKKNKEGYILEVDIKYPKELHKTHDKRPF